MEQYFITADEESRKLPAACSICSASKERLHVANCNCTRLQARPAPANATVYKTTSSIIQSGHVGIRTCVSSYYSVQLAVPGLAPAPHSSIYTRTHDRLLRGPSHTRRHTGWRKADANTLSAYSGSVQTLVGSRGAVNVQLGGRVGPLSPAGGDGLSVGGFIVARDVVRDFFLFLRRPGFGRENG